jgi:hypothetical protein
MKTFLNFIITICLFSACRESKSTVYSIEKENAEREGLTAATVRDFAGLDGCSFLVVLNDSTRLEPVELADSLKRNELKLWIRYKPENDYMSICMGGTAVRITEARFRTQ